MDYEKKYKEALEKAREIIKDYENRGLKDNLFYANEDFEAIFPELKESEDEKIRKAILELVRQLSEVLDKQNQNNMIAWLEKQGEKDKLIQELGEYKVKYTQEVLEKYINTNDERLRKISLKNTENDYTKVYEWLKKNKDRYVHNLGTCGEYIPYCSDKMITDLKNYVESN